MAAAATIGGNDSPSAPISFALHLERHCDLALGAPDEAVLGDQPFIQVVRERGRAADQLDLLVVLDGPQLLDEPAGRHQLGGIADEVREPPVRADRQVRVVEADPQPSVLGTPFVMTWPPARAGRLRPPDLVVGELRAGPARSTGSRCTKSRWPGPMSTIPFVPRSR